MLLLLCLEVCLDLNEIDHVWIWALRFEHKKVILLYHHAISLTELSYSTGMLYSSLRKPCNCSCEFLWFGEWTWENGLSFLCCKQKHGFLLKTQLLWSYCFLDRKMLCWSTVVWRCSHPLWFVDSLKECSESEVEWKLELTEEMKNRILHRWKTGLECGQKTVWE